MERTLAAGDAHAYTLDLDAGQFVLGAADQITVDVEISLAGPDGERIQSFDQPARGPEPFRFTTETAGVYTLTVTPYGGEEGRYVMRLVRAEPVATTPEGAIDQQLAGFDERSPGVAVAVVRGGEVVFENGYGAANLEHGVPITPETVLSTGSVGKQFTAFAIAMLADQGHLGLDDDVSSHVPEFSVGQRVTVRHLLHHTSGVRDTWGLLGLAGRRDGDLVSKEVALDLILRQRGLGFEPGARFEYSNSNYILLAEVVERVTGEPFRSWMQDHVFGPLQMRHTFVGDDHREIIAGRAASYAPTAGGYDEEVLPYSIYGSSGVYSTVGDLARWLSNFGTAEVGGDAVARQMRQRGVLADGDTLDYALGVFVDEHRGLQRIQHSGSIAGYRSFVAYYPEIDAGVVVLGNGSSSQPRGHGRRYCRDVLLRQRLGPKAPKLWRSLPEHSPRVRPRRRSTRRRLTRSRVATSKRARRATPSGSPEVGDGYVVQLVGQPEWGISPVGPTQFSTRGGLGITFDVSADGSVDTLSAPRLGGRGVLPDPH